MYLVNVTGHTLVQSHFVNLPAIVSLNVFVLFKVLVAASSSPFSNILAHQVVFCLSQPGESLT
eukprot:m.175388 g.175388  ORF g.175388 m.175388 type:complete len:63 (+) comp39128_c0_seq8:585-773(+)